MPVTLSFSPISEPGAADLTTLFTRRAEKAKKKKSVRFIFQCFFLIGRFLKKNNNFFKPGVIDYGSFCMSVVFFFLQLEFPILKK